MGQVEIVDDLDDGTIHTVDRIFGAVPANFICIQTGNLPFPTMHWPTSVSAIDVNNTKVMFLNWLPNSFLPRDMVLFADVQQLTAVHKMVAKGERRLDTNEVSRFLMLGRRLPALPFRI